MLSAGGRPGQVHDPAAVQDDGGEPGGDRQGPLAQLDDGCRDSRRRNVSGSLLIRAGRLRYFFLFSIVKNDIFCIFLSS